MSDRFGELTSILEREARLHDELIETAGAINKAIKENAIEVIQQNTARYDEQIFQVEKLEELRLDCCTSIAGSPSNPSGTRLNSILELAGEPGRSRLSALRGSLKQKLSDLAKLNTSNRVLLEEALGAIENTFNAFRQSSNRYAPYRHKGALAKPVSAYAMINRTI